ncbi:hypothetical protein ACFQU7_41245 [Pseudoroseomonas wenyumeiae]
MPEDFKWPPRSALRLYQGDRLLVTSSDRRIDLSDRLMGPDDPSRRKLLRAEQPEHERHLVNLGQGLMRYDLDFDELLVRIKRMSQSGYSCHEGFSWSLDIRDTILKAA